MDLEFLFGAAVGTAITGAVFEKLEKVKLFCTQCGKEVQSGASFCCYCGAKVQGTAKGIESMYREAMDYYREGKYRKAISILEKLIEFGRSDSMIYLALWYSWSKLATSQRDNKRIFLSATDKVVKYHKVILRLHRQGISIPADMLEEVKKITKACQTYKDVLTGKLQVQSNEGAKYEHKADLAMKAGDPKKALQWINKAIEAETNDVWVARYHVRRAVIRNALSDYAGALADCKIALECKGLNKEAREVAEDIQNSVKAKQYSHKYELAVEAKDAKKALQYITKAIELETNDGLIAVYLAQRAMVKGALGDYAGASSDCKIALKYKGFPAKLRETIVDIQRSAQDSLKSTTGKGRTRTKANVKKTGKRAAQSVKVHN